MTIYDLKPKFQALLRPIVDRLHRWGVTPNQITWMALILSLLVGVVLAMTKGANWVLILIPFVMFVRMALNAIDGILAKEYDMRSDSGAMLNELGDVISDAALYLPFAFISGVSPLLVVLFVVVGLLAEVAGILGAVVGSERRYDGPMGKSDRAFVMGALALLIGMGVTTGWWSDGVLLLSIVLGLVTVLNRAKRGLA